MKLLKLIPDNTNIDFMRWRNLGLAISVLLMVGGWVLVGVKGLNFGVDLSCAASAGAACIASTSLSA